MFEKEAVVVGGSNGIGLTIAKKLQEENYYVYILDVVEPSDGCLNKQYKYIKCNVMDLDYDVLRELANRPNIELLMITAGIGRIANFADLDLVEIRKTMEINANGIIQLIHEFYEKIASKETFYCGVMGSIAGFISSPMFSVYAASKAAVCRFIESVNIELENSGTSNRILNVSPGAIKGTRFNGGKNDFNATSALAVEIIKNLKASNELFIPEYEDVFKGVLHRYYTDPHQFGLSSYQYKLSSGRASAKSRTKIGYLSGTFDLFHVGHLNLLKRAKEHCDYLIVGVHRDGSHKGKETFVPFEERMQIVGACKYVDRVVESCREDSDAWNLWHYDRLFVGSDYKGSERFERYERYFCDKGVEIIYFPYTKGTSSTQLRAQMSKSMDE